MSQQIKLYCVQMIRYGNPNSHSYVIALTKSHELATLLGVAHGQYRGGKYDPNILEFDLKEQDEYFLVEQFDEDKTNTIVNVFDNINYVQSTLEQTPREKDDCKKIQITKSMSLDSLLDCHNQISTFSHKELEVLRDMYEKYIRTKYYY